MIEFEELLTLEFAVEAVSIRESESAFKESGVTAGVGSNYLAIEIPEIMTKMTTKNMSMRV